ncbi:MAG: Asp-tRNA(Asn)/Glu-tRNA(Gln) amidotransferase subunit GatC [Acidobacteriota bacterium]
MPARRDDFAIRHVASLARLALTPAEEDLYTRQLGDILAYATQLLQLETPALPIATPDPSARVPLREDRVQPSVARDAVLAGAPDADQDAGLFRVPRVIG